MKADQEAEPLENVEDATSKEKSPAGGGLKKLALAVCKSRDQPGDTQHLWAVPSEDSVPDQSDAVFLRRTCAQEGAIGAAAYVWDEI
ncbi:hypothetical protein [Rhodopseudomonas sp. BR0G17]|uniref:hypothetical protein n=1 Tax=Rhodopseudomonas sp. BR0G17 TaxID=2269368 RepID=UPI0013DFC525|nr:hypothetical protein [Rhodopseudomonas sp. BR0G17]